ncbi:MAG: phage holin family protein [Alistipes sp.]|nr:phage holin family protein [Alistipes sp.]
MEILCKLFSGIVAALAAVLCPAATLVGVASLFILIDFITGVTASCIVARREGRKWWFESRKAWRTVFKTGFVAISIVMMWLIDHHLLEFMHLNLANIFTGFVCGVELWSFLENAAAISRSPLFDWLSRWVKRRIGEEVADE